MSLNNVAYYKNNFTRLEKYYLRLLLSGFGEKERIEFFDFDIARYHHLEASIQLKFNTKNWCEILLHYLRSIPLSIADYPHFIVKRCVLGFLNELDTVNMEDTGFALQLNSMLINGVSDIQTSFKDDKFFKNKISKLTETQVLFVNMIFNGMSLDAISLILKISETDVNLMIAQIFNMLSSSNWIEIYRHMFWAQLLEIKSNSKYKKIKKFKKRIVELTETNYTLKEKQYLIYKELAAYYTDFELSFILKNGHFYL